MSKVVPRIILSLLVIIIVYCSLVITNIAIAEQGIVDIPGISFDSDTKYDFLTSSPVVNMVFGKKSLGTLQISGDISSFSKEHKASVSEDHEVPAYGVEKGDLVFSYRYNQALLFDEESDWQLASDSGKKVGNIEVKDKIGMGVLIVQSSIDGLSWTIEDNPIYNIFSDYPEGIENFYITRDSDINVGKFYRVIVAYQTNKKVGSTDIWFYHRDNYTTRFHVEIYELYASINDGVIAILNLVRSVSDTFIEAEAHESKKQYYIDIDDSPVQKMSFGKKSLGETFISGQIVKNYDINGIPAFEVARGKIDFAFRYDLSPLNETETENVQSLNTSNAQTIDNIDVGGKIGKGVLIVQKSKDGVVWENAVPPAPNFFENDSANSEIIYTTSEDDVEIGCYYRIIIAYETRIKTGSTKIVFYSNDHYEYPKHVEIYKFYLKLSEVTRSVDLFSTEEKEADFGFEIDKMGKPYDVNVENEPASQGERFTKKGIYNVSVKSIYGKEITKVIHILNGQEEDAPVENVDAVVVEPSELIEPTEVPAPTPDSKEKTYYFDDIVLNAGNDTGYSRKNERDIKDPHFGWDIGQFFVTGFTEKKADEDGTPVFLKMPDDKIALWFNLDQDINSLNGRTQLKVVDDKNGNDKFFGIEKVDFGKGVLIVQHADFQNKTKTPVWYTNYLSAKAVLNENTRVDLFEEGDYKVALNYKIKEDNFFGGNHQSYRIFFEYKVRNGDCMVFPKDLTTKELLQDGANTKNGFEIDLAKSRYLGVIVKGEPLEGGRPFINGSAKDGDKYTDKGKYTISAQNKFTGAETTVTIYVREK